MPESYLLFFSFAPTLHPSFDNAYRRYPRTFSPGLSGTRRPSEGPPPLTVRPGILDHPDSSNSNL